MNISIKRTKRRKTIIIQVKDGLVEVRAPFKIEQKEIDSFILQKNSWINKKLSLQKSIKKPTRKKFKNEENFQFLGKNLKLKITISENKKSYIDDKFIYLVLKNNKENFKEKIKEKLEIFFRETAKDIFKNKTLDEAKKIRVTPKKIIVRSYKRRWGSCSYKKDISYNWKLIMAPEKIIHYVVIHELCHLIHFNHSRDFWKSVGKILPDYKSSKEWLKLNQHLLDW
jgi:predicted metal-dependent hydrolase